MLRALFLLIFALHSFLLFGQKMNDTYVVQIIQAGWHTGIIMKTSDIPPSIFKAIERYNNHKYIDFSWGDEKYYQIPDPNLYITARSVLWPTQSVISIDAFSRDIFDYYRQPEIVEINMSKDQFYNLCRILANSFIRDNNGGIIRSTFYRDSSDFFLSKRKYSALRTCNTWVALVLKETGFDISSFFLITTNQLFRRLRKLPHSTLVLKQL